MIKRLLLIIFCGLSISLLADNPPVNKVSLYPNPAVSYVDIAFSETVQSEVTVTISDILGNKIETFTFKPGEQLRIEFEPLHLKNGIYLFKIESQQEVTLKRLVIKQ